VRICRCPALGAARRIPLGQVPWEWLKFTDMTLLNVSKSIIYPTRLQLLSYPCMINMWTTIYSWIVQNTICFVDILNKPTNHLENVLRLCWNAWRCMWTRPGSIGVHWGKLMGDGIFHGGKLGNFLWTLLLNGWLSKSENRLKFWARMASRWLVVFFYPDRWKWALSAERQ